MNSLRSSPPDRCPGQISWEYDRTEIIADGVVHAIGVCLGFAGAIAIVAIAVKLDGIDVAPVLVYVIGLVTMLAFSAAYNMWPVSPAKWILRRFDHGDPCFLPLGIGASCGPRDLAFGSGATLGAFGRPHRRRRDVGAG